jgi:hypothetical protein
LMADVKKSQDLREKLCDLRKKLKLARRGKSGASASQVAKWENRKKEILDTIFPKKAKKG